MRYLLKCSNCRSVFDDLDLDQEEDDIELVSDESCFQCKKALVWTIDVGGSIDSGHLQDVTAMFDRRAQAQNALSTMRKELGIAVALQGGRDGRQGRVVGTISGSGIRQLLAMIIDHGVQSVKAHLGVDPPCLYTCIVFGSTARDDGGAYPDLDYAFLVNDESEPCIRYFELLAQYVGDAIHLLGEETVGETYGFHSCYGGASPFFRNYGWRYRDGMVRRDLDHRLATLVDELDELIAMIEPSFVAHETAQRFAELAARVRQLDLKNDENAQAIGSLKAMKAKLWTLRENALQKQACEGASEELTKLVAELAEHGEQIKARKAGMQGNTSANLAERLDIQRERARLILTAVRHVAAQGAYFAPWMHKFILRLFTISHTLTKARWLSYEDRRVDDHLHTIHSHASRQRSRGTVTLIAKPESLAQWARPDKDDLLRETAKRIASKQEMHPKSRFFLRQITNPGDYCDFVSVKSGPGDELVSRLFKARQEILQGPPSSLKLTLSIANSTLSVSCGTRAQELFAKIIVENALACQTTLSPGEPIDVKKAFWRFPQTLIAFLCQMHGITVMNSFQRIQALREKLILSPDLAEELHAIYGYLVCLRVRCHMHYQCEMHTVFIGAPTIDQKVKNERDECLARIRTMHDDIAALRRKMYETRPLEADFLQLFQLESKQFTLYKTLDSLNQALTLTRPFKLTDDDSTCLDKRVVPFLTRLKEMTLDFVAKASWNKFG